MSVTERIFVGLPTIVIGGLSILIFWLPIAIVTWTMHYIKKAIGGDGYSEKGLENMNEVGYWWWRNFEYTFYQRDEAEMFPKYKN